MTLLDGMWQKYPIEDCGPKLGFPRRKVVKDVVCLGHELDFLGTGPATEHNPAVVFERGLM